MPVRQKGPGFAESYGEGFTLFRFFLRGEMPSNVRLEELRYISRESNTGGLYSVLRTGGRSGHIMLCVRSEVGNRWGHPTVLAAAIIDGHQENPGGIFF